MTSTNLQTCPKRWVKIEENGIKNGRGRGNYLYQNKGALTQKRCPTPSLPEDDILSALLLLSYEKPILQKLSFV